MLKAQWSWLVVGFVLFAGQNSAWAENKKICVKVVLERAPASPVAPQPSPPPLQPPTRHGPTVDAATAAAAEKAPGGTAKDLPSKTGIVEAGAEGDVLPPMASPSKVNLPIGQRPLAYLKRLVEYSVSHENGFVAVETSCDETMTFQLYPLLEGWTAFARYTGTGREERIDRLAPEELSQFAERAATALLYGKPISATIKRGTLSSQPIRNNTRSASAGPTTS